MPEAQEKALWAEVRRKHPDWPDERKRAFVYGIMRGRGWKPSWEK